MAVAGQLVQIQQQLVGGMPSADAATQIQQVVAALVPSSSEFTVPATPASPPAAAPDKVPALAVVSDPADAEAAGAQESDASAPAAAAAG
jgi:hypothetical protein